MRAARAGLRTGATKSERQASGLDSATRRRVGFNAPETHAEAHLFW